MAILTLGVILWIATHNFPLYAPDAKARIVARIGAGPWKGLFALVSVAVIVLMVQGWSAAAGSAQLWTPPAFLTHLNNLLVLIAFIVFGAGHAQSNLRRVIRHPQFTAVKIWAVAHLLVNGDLRSVVLFGGLLVWAGMGVAFANRRDGPRVKPPATPRQRDIAAATIGTLLFLVVGYSHQWLFGVWPFPG